GLGRGRPAGQVRGAGGGPGRHRPAGGHAPGRPPHAVGRRAAAGRRRGRGAPPGGRMAGPGGGLPGSARPGPAGRRPGRAALGRRLTRVFTSLEPCPCAPRTCPGDASVGPTAKGDWLTPEQPSKGTVLLVEDEASIADLVRLYLG